MPDTNASSRRRTGLPEPFVCAWSSDGLDAAWVHLAGELDVATTPQLEGVLRAPQLRARLVVLDLRDLTFMGTTGVHAIVKATTRARRRGCRLVVLRGRPQVHGVFALTGSAEYVEIGDVD